MEESEGLAGQARAVTLGRVEFWVKFSPHSSSRQARYLHLLLAHPLSFLVPHERDIRTVYDVGIRTVPGVQALGTAASPGQYGSMSSTDTSNEEELKPRGGSSA